MKAKKTLCLVEKPAAERAFQKALSETHKEMDYFSVIPYARLAFKYPPHSSFSSVPITIDASFKVLPVQVYGLGGTKNIEEISALLDQYETIIIAPDPDHTGFFTTIQMLYALKGRYWVNSHPNLLSVSKLDAWTDNHIQKVFNDVKPLFQDSTAWQFYHQGEIARHFDYNFNLNSNLIFRKLGVQLDSNITITKFMLQALFIEELKTGMNKQKILKTMEQWKGTGKYPVSQIGSCASRVKIIENLINLGMLEEDLTAKKILLSDKVRSFLAVLHKDCKDADLPGRMDVWRNRGNIVETKKAINSYLNRFFGKQKRFQLKQ